METQQSAQAQTAEKAEHRTPLTDAALRRTQGLFRAAAACNGFAAHAYKLEVDNARLAAANVALVAIVMSVAEESAQVDGASGRNYDTYQITKGVIEAARAAIAAQGRAS